MNVFEKTKVEQEEIDNLKVTSMLDSGIEDPKNKY